ncbi:MAG TPA: VOC family protein [Steroidobacteraceae bacterium]|nr:VOC family protein [Steroidobacteraceae bacterium]
MDAPGFSISGIDHIVLRVRDVARALEFYRDTLGCTVEREQRALGLTQLRAGRSLIDLVTAEGPLGRRAVPGALSGPNVEHFCLTLVPFDEDALRSHLAAHGVEAGEGAVRYGAEGEGRSIYIEDPDGNRIELKGGRT